jgi:hypothetical protein
LEADWLTWAQSLRAVKKGCSLVRKMLDAKLGCIMYVVTLAVGLEAVKIACSYVILFFYEEENVLCKPPHRIVMRV